jgi:hypothetical protein
MQASSLLAHASVSRLNFFSPRLRIGVEGPMARNILEVIHAVSSDESFAPVQNLKQIGKISKGYAPMLTEILGDYIQQNTGGPAYRVERIKAAKQMLGVGAKQALPGNEVFSGSRVENDKLQKMAQLAATLAACLDGACDALEASDLPGVKAMLDKGMAEFKEGGGFVTPPPTRTVQ